MSDVQMEVLNLPEFQARVQGWGAALTGKVLDHGLEAGADLLTEEIKARAPVKTGRLKRGIKVKRKGPGVLAVDLGGQQHGQFQEFGSRHQPARPFMRPALDENRERVVDAIADAIRAVLG